MSGYIGTAPVPQATQTRDSFTATSGQTSFATGGYTPQFLSVYLNGIFLNNGADYTAANGSDVILTTGAATGDILEVVAYTAFDTANVTGATNFTVTGAFTSQGIDDNGNATAITIDGNENVLIGKTANDVTVVGTQINSDGFIGVTRNGNIPALFNRTTSDGDIISLRKNGSAVGSIGVVGSDILFLANPDGTGCGLNFDGDNPKINPTNGSGSGTNGIVDLGWSGGRFKDAYLSGGVYLGGTGSANKLDDFEEGLYTVSVQTGSGNISLNSTNNKYSYVKVGKLVTVTGRIDVSSVSSPSGPLYLNLPFTASTGVKYESAISLFIWNSTSSAPETGLWVGWVTNGASQIQIRYGNSNTPSANVANYIQANTEFRISVSYETDA